MSCTRTRGKKGDPHLDPRDPPRRRANKVRGWGSYARDRPPIFILISRDSGTVRFFVRDQADSATCLAVIASTAPRWASVVYTDELSGYGPVEDELHIMHASVKHSRTGDRPREWARDDDGDGLREVHCNSCEGAGAGLRTFLRMFRGVHKTYLADYVAVYETMINAKEMSTETLRRMCFGDPLMHADYA